MIKKTFHSPCFRLRLLGGFVFERRDEKALGLSYKKGRAVLAYLASEPVAHERQKLAALFWPNLPGQDAHSNLRQVLLNLRKCVNDVSPCLITERQQVRFDPSGACEVDLTDFCRELPVCAEPLSSRRCESCLAGMEAAAGLYRGEFLAGFSLPECEEFEEWLLLRREALHRHALLRLERLCSCLEKQNEFAKALPHALRYIELEPWNEAGHRRVMRLFARDGQVGNALSQYDRCSRALKRGLGLTPSAETRQLVARIRSGLLLSRGPEQAAGGQHVSAAEPRLERRQVTVLYYELNIHEVEDPEDALALLQSPQRRCDELLEDFSGYRVQSHGGGALVYFGYPQASEQAASRAVRAALALCAEDFPGMRLWVGVHTGEILLGDNPGIPDALGVTSAVAMRLPFGAGPGEVVISESTRQLIAGYFTVSCLGRQRLRGQSHPVELFWVVGASGARTRLEAAATLSPFCGRQRELALLMALWQQAVAGSGRALLLQGDAGIGKSRLIHTLRSHLGQEVCVVRELRCLPELSRSPLQPLIDLCGELLGFVPADDAERKFAKLLHYAGQQYPGRVDQVVPLLASLLAIPLREPFTELSLSPAQQRAMTYALMIERMQVLAVQAPLLLVVEDLHWADPSTLELLSLLVDEVPQGAILMLMSARPQFLPPWDDERVPRHRLETLPVEEAQRLVRVLATDFSDELVDEIVVHADGVPLFVEEMTVLACSAAPDMRTAVPATLQDLLTARLDDVGAAKQTAQLAANLGREFRLDMLSRISPLEAATLNQQLDRLFEAGLVRQLTDQVFQFKHALVQDAARQSQKKTTRQAAHRRIAQVLQDDFPEIVSAQPETLARHLALAGEYGEAIVGWIKAGNRAALYSASQEARQHYAEGLALLGQLPESARKLQFEFDLQVGLGSVACITHGYGSNEATGAYLRAMELGKQGVGGADLFQVVWGLWASASSRASYAQALALAEQLLGMGGSSGDPVQLQQGHFSLGNSLFWQGEFTRARRHLEQAIALYQPEHHPRHLRQFGENVRVTSGAYLSRTLWFLGYPDRARDVSEETLALARQLNHPFSLGYALTFAALLQRHLRRPAAALAAAEETLALAAEQGFPLWQIAGSLLQGWGEVMDAEPAGRARMLRSVESVRSVMGGVALSFLEPLIEVHLHQQDYAAADSLLKEAFAVVETLGDRHVEAELHRLQGVCLLGRFPANREAAEACFQQALRVSRRQQAKALELRAATHLGRLWLSQKKRVEARNLVQGVYGFFREGLDTRDLGEARELLAQIGL